MDVISPLFELFFVGSNSFLSICSCQCANFSNRSYRAEEVRFELATPRLTATSLDVWFLSYLIGEINGCFAPLPQPKHNSQSRAPKPRSLLAHYVLPQHYNFHAHKQACVPENHTASVYFKKIRQPPTLPCRLQQSTIGRLSLNRRVRDGNGCYP